MAARLFWMGACRKIPAAGAASRLPLLLLLAAGAAAQPSGRLADWTQTAVIPLAGQVHHVQGIDVEGDVLWVSSVHAPRRKGYLTRFALPSGRLVRQVEVQHGRRIHPGGITLDGDSLWVPVAEYDRDGPTTIERRRKDSLALASSFEVADHIGCVAAAPDGLIGGNWDSRLLYRWSREGRELGRQPNPGSTGYQDLKAVDGFLIGAGIAGRKAGWLEWLDLRDFTIRRRVEAGRTDRGVLFTREGMTFRDGKLYLLPEDDPSRLFVFTPPGE
jgi:hypothetical protein